MQLYGFFFFVAKSSSLCLILMCEVTQFIWHFPSLLLYEFRQKIWVSASEKAIVSQTI
jgi:hypothetical protein